MMGDYDSGGMDPNWRPPGHSAAELEKDNESLRTQLTEVRAEVGHVDAVLARRPALAEKPTRVDKILHAISRADKGEQDTREWKRKAEAAEARTTAAEAERDELAAQLRMLKLPLARAHQQQEPNK